MEYILYEVLQRTASLVSSTFYETNKNLFVEEHLIKLADNINYYYQHGAPLHNYQPAFKEELIVPYSDSFTFFYHPLNELKRGNKEQLPLFFAKALEDTGIENLLILLGQRLTPASVRDASGIPPTRSALETAANKSYTTSLTVAAREWTKHTNRSSDRFWGEITGGDKDKNAKANYYIHQIISKASWWNIFYHYKHELVYELRLPTGHGTRWSKDGNELIGFLEPFVD